MIDSSGFVDFVLQGLDPATQTVCVEWRVQIADIDRLRAILGPDCEDDDDLQRTYYNLSGREMQRVGKLCQPPLVPDDVYRSIGRRSTLYDAIPYMIHTGFELPLMLDGRKPLTVLSDGYPSEWFDEYLAPFEQFVAAGRFVHRIFDRPMPQIKRFRSNLDGIRTILFALPGEEWRIDAYIDSILNRTGNWDDGLERLQGSLLGYEEWQND